MIVSVPHGTDRVALSFPPTVRVEVHAPREAPPASDPQALLARALDAPVDAAPLADAARGRARVAVLVPDPTRPAATAVVLPAVLARLAAAGVPLSAVRVLVARGIHARPGEADLGRAWATEAARRTPLPVVEPSEPDDPDANADLAPDETIRPLRVHRAAAEADLVILCGAVAPHYLAGFSGGPKTLVPGVAQHETVAAAHRVTLDATVAPDGSVRSWLGRTEGNRFHAALLRVARRLGTCWSVNAVLDARGGLAHVEAGEVGASQRAAARWWTDACAVPRPEPADLVVAACGAPRDDDLVQAHKSLVAAAEVARPGAPIVWFARAPRGAGHPEFLQWFETGRPAKHLAALRRAFHPYGLTAYALKWKAGQHPVHVVSDVSPDVLRPMGLLPFREGQAALDHALAGSRVERCVVLPRAGDTCFAEGQGPR